MIHTHFKFNLIVLSLFAAVHLPAYAGERMEVTVRHLGESADSLSDDLDKLKRDPHRAVELLVGQLRVVPRRVYFERNKTRQSRHVIGCLRAMRYLTGMTFSAKTNAVLSSDEKQFLDFKKELRDANPGHELHFFSVWMSRNAEFVAPEDAQAEIIEKWRTWLRLNGSTFKYKPAGKAGETTDDWFWFG